MPRRFYSSKYAHDEYRSVLVDCRAGINQTPESIQSMNDLLVPLIKEKHQSIGHIYATHAEELGCSRRTLYSYINDCVFDVRNGDLRRSVRYKKRKKPTQTSAKDRSYRQGHNYEDFQNYMKDHPDINVVEMDCVEGKKGESRALLTFTFRNCNLMLMFLLEYQDQECVLEVFVWLETVLGQDAFKKLFPVILTDGGSEFSAREEMEEFCDGSKSTTVFYCDPYSFWQKGACEKNHEYIRYIRPKGSSFADLNDEKVRLMMNGQDAFKKLFPVILTDGGSEFSAREEMEEFCDGNKSTTVFYCDPYSFWQKGACEKNHEYIRYIRPKGSSFADLNDEKVRLMMNHINNEKRDSLNGHSPYELSLLLLDNKLHKALGLKAIAPDDVMLSPKLIK